MNCPRPTARSTSTSDRRRRRSAHVTPSSRTSSGPVDGDHCGYFASSGATLRDLEGLERRGVAAERLGHRDVVEAHQPEPRVLGVARLAGRSSSRSTSTYSTSASRPICSSTGLGNTSDPKIAGTPAARDLLDQVGDLARRRVLEVRHLDRADHLPVVVLGEVGVGVVVGEQLARRDRRERRAHRRVELVDHRGERVVVGGVVVGVVGVARGHVVAARSRRSAAPAAGRSTGAGSACRPPRGTRSRRCTRPRRSSACPSSTISASSARFASASSLVGSSSCEPVEVHDVGRREQLGDARLRLERVRVRALGDDAHDVGPVTDDVGDDAGDRRDGRRHEQA